jgi:tetratricopeptide (TPR) repeat protein
LNGVLIFWFIEKLRYYLPLTKPWNQWLPILVSFTWLIHPIHTNTVLYAVQRMTELSTLFILVGLLCYLHARKLFYKKTINAWLWILIGGGLSLLSALLSKENGILLVTYVLVIEYILIRQHGYQTSKTLNKALLLCAWLPTTLLIIMLYKWGWIDQTSRSFNTIERLMSEARIIWIYIIHIIIPSYNGTSLLYDDIIISRNLFSPITTLPAIIGIFTLMAFSWWIRKTLPVLSFAIAWFFVGHLLESTTIALELYFEHRNYLPSLGFILVGMYYALYIMQNNIKLRSIIPLILLCYLSLIGISTHHIANLWTTPVQLFTGWLEQHPNSQRTLEGIDALIGTHISQTTRQKLLIELDHIATKQTSISYLIFRNLKIDCQNQSLKPEHLPQALKNLSNTSFIAPLPNVLADFVYAWTETDCGGITTEQMSSFLNSFGNIESLQQGEMPQILHYWQAEVHAKQGNLAEAMLHFDKAYALDKNVDLLLLQSAYLMSAGLYTEANNKLSNAETDFCDHWRSCMILKLRQPDIDNLKTAIQAAQQKANNNEQAVHHSSSEKRG